VRDAGGHRSHRNTAKDEEQNEEDTSYFHARPPPKACPTRCLVGETRDYYCVMG
jgi:hypothetical protein